MAKKKFAKKKKTNAPPEPEKAKGMEFSQDAQDFERYGRCILNSLVRMHWQIAPDHRALGRRCGFSHVTVHRLLTGKQRLSFAYFATICKALDEDPYKALAHVAKKKERHPDDKTRHY